MCHLLSKPQTENKIKFCLVFYHQEITYFRYRDKIKFVNCQSLTQTSYSPIQQLIKLYIDFPLVLVSQITGS